MTDERNIDGQDRSQQERVITTLKSNGWIIVPQPPMADGSVLMKLTTANGEVSHIVVMLNGDRVDARQKLGKNPAVLDKGEPH